MGGTVDLEWEILKSKLIFGGLIGLAVIGAIIGTKLLKKPIQAS